MLLHAPPPAGMEALLNAIELASVAQNLSEPEQVLTIGELRDRYFFCGLLHLPRERNELASFIATPAVSKDQTDIRETIISLSEYGFDPKDGMVFYHLREPRYRPAGSWTLVDPVWLSPISLRISL